MDLTLNVWRQNGPEDKGRMETHPVSGVSPDMSFLEMIDMLNDQIIRDGGDPVAFDHDCREGICGTCSLNINGRAHGPLKGVTACQLHMRKFKDGDTIFIEPFRANAFPVIKDLIVDRSAFDRIQHSGGFISVNTSGNTQDGNSIPIPKKTENTNEMKALLIPTSALVNKGELSGIYTVSQSNTAVLRWLRLGRTYGDKVEILSGLNADESYIESAEGKLFNGAKVTIQ